MLQHANHVTLSLKNAKPASKKVGYKQVLFISHKYNQVNYLHLHFRPPVKSPECFLTSIFYNNLEHKLTRALPFYFNIPNFEPEAFFFKGASTTCQAVISFQKVGLRLIQKKLTRKKLSSQNLKILIQVGGSLPTSSFQCIFFQTPKKKGGDGGRATP